MIVGFVVLGPWIIFLVYDLLLYISRAVTYEVPYIGGRARGRQRPIAPCLVEKPNGRPRGFSINASAASSGIASPGDREWKRKRGHRKNRSGGGGSRSKSRDTNGWDDGESPVIVEK
jgi:hypothetical protein